MRQVVWGVVLALAGCAAGGGGDASLPVVRPGPVKGATLPVAQGEADLVVRAVSGSAPGQEIDGATCNATSAYFAASFTPPARLLVPDFGTAAPTITVACQAGKARGSVLVPPEAVWSNGVGGWPAVGISVGTGNMSGVGVGVGWWGGSAGATAGVPVTRYPAVRVALQ